MLPLVFVLVIVCAIATPIDFDPKIIGGLNAREGQFKHQVSLRQSHTNNHFCGGSIISSEWILTAAHCVQYTAPSSVAVVVGTIYLNVGGYGYGVSKIVSHHGYNPQNNVADIAVLRINGKINLNEKVGYIPLYSSSVSGNKKMTLSGWGLTSYPSIQLPNHLQYIQLTSMDLLKCQSALPGYPINNTHICTTSPAGQGACQGDSGGPLLFNNTQYLYQVGVVSWGVPCAKGSPDVFTSVPAYRYWIQAATGV